MQKKFPLSFIIKMIIFPCLEHTHLRKINVCVKWNVFAAAVSSAAVSSWVFPDHTDILNQLTNTAATDELH